MKNSISIFAVLGLTSFLLFNCGNNNTCTEEKARIIKEYKDSLAAAEKAKQDSIENSIPDIKVNIYARTDVGYDSEGYALEMGKLVLIEGFQEKKDYQLSGYDYIEKIEITGKSDDITLQFYNGKSNKIVHEEKAISLNGTKTYTASDPQANKNIYHQEWLNTNLEPLIIKVIFKDKNIFEGRINPSEK